MKLPALLSNLHPSTVFGQVSWQPPIWWRRAQDGWRRLSSAHPRLLALAIIALLLLCGGAAWTWHWYQSLPKPRFVSVKVQPIPVTELKKDLQYPRLVVYFGESAARLEDLHKPSLQGVRLDPHIAGAWHWASGDVLVFEPAEDWPADQEFQIIFDRKFFPRHVLMERLTYRAHTPPFTIAIKQLEFYQDPIDPAKRQVTATLELTHAVESGELDRHLQLAMIGGSPVFPPNDPPPHFAITYGLHRRLAYLRSSSITLPEREDFMKLTLSKGVRTTQGGAQTQDATEQKVRIPSVATMFRIDSIDSTVARNKSGEPEQLLILTTTADISTRDLAKALEIRLLPKRQVPEAEKDADDSVQSSDSDDEESDSGEEAAQSEWKEKERWQSATDVPDDVLDQAKPIEFSALPSEKARDRQHAFRVRVEAEGELYVRVRKGVRAYGDYPLADDYNAVVSVPQLPREVQIESQGGLLALNGERKLSIRSRGLAAIEYEIARVATTQINHLVSQTEGNFQHPRFQAPEFFNEENISRIAIEHQSIALESKWKANYSAFDFSEQLRKPSDGGSERGLFFLTARGWDPATRKSIKSIRDSRFLLVTDIGILTKHNADGSHDIFLMSIKEGKPLGGAVVDLLGKNGIAIQTARTDADGHCAFSSVEKSVREKAPVAFVARNGDDVAFIPYARDDRALNFSRFDIDGVDNVLPENLDAFVFTERGVYRPGDEMHIGLIVKQRNWQGQLKGLPIETEVVDARGHVCANKKNQSARNGVYRADISDRQRIADRSLHDQYLSDQEQQALDFAGLGHGKRKGISARSDEDRDATCLQHPARLDQSQAKFARPLRWPIFMERPRPIGASTAHMELSPAAFYFPEFPGYVFYDPLVDEKKDRQAQTVELGEKKTDDSGQAEFDLHLERFADATYSMRFIAEGFEAEGGRSVTGESSALVSALPYVIGCKADGDLSYTEMGKPRALDLIAIDPQLNRIAVENVTLNIIAQEYVSVLTKQQNGNYVYRIGAQGARHQIREDRRFRKRIALHAADDRAGQLHLRIARRSGSAPGKIAILRGRARSGLAFAGKKRRAPGQTRSHAI